MTSVILLEDEPVLRNELADYLRAQGHAVTAVATLAEFMRVFEPNKRLIGIIETPEICANIAFGGPDLKTLLLTASTSVYTLRTKVPGVPHPWYKQRKG